MNISNADKGFDLHVYVSMVIWPLDQIPLKPLNFDLNLSLYKRYICRYGGLVRLS